MNKTLEDNARDEFLFKLREEASGEKINKKTNKVLAEDRTDKNNFILEMKTGKKIDKCQYSFYLSNDLHNRIVKTAQITGRSKSEIVEAALKKILPS